MCTSSVGTSTTPDLIHSIKKYHKMNKWYTNESVVTFSPINYQTDEISNRSTLCSWLEIRVWNRQNCRYFLYRESWYQTPFWLVKSITFILLSKQVQNEQYEYHCLMYRLSSNKIKFEAVNNLILRLPWISFTQAYKHVMLQKYIQIKRGTNMCVSKQIIKRSTNLKCIKNI